MYRGVMLAGGLATRLPNKPLLPLRNLKPAITSGLDFFKRSGIDDVYVVIPPSSPIPDVLAAFGYHVKYCVQSTPTGVCGAIATLQASRPSMVNLNDDDRLIVTYCDNVYDELSVMPEMHNVASGHSIMYIENEVKSHALSKYNDGVWVHDSKSPWCVAGWMVLDEHARQLAASMTSTEMLLNAAHGVPIRVAAAGWWDIGTIETYSAYWRATL